MPQHVYVGLVRGINVGTANQVGMNDFRGVFETLGYTEVKTLLRSGNVVFSAAHPLTAADVAAIEKRFTQVAEFSAHFVILSGADFLEITDENPLLAVATDPSRLVVAYLPATSDARAALTSTSLTIPDPDSVSPDVLAVGPRAVYVWCPNGISKSTVPPSFWRQLGPAYTARNVNTAAKLAALVRARL
ncbi:DUF1697 domain-containing protein [Subtercola lobariae]|uniref:DUF1697 domain-containing protein n=1 Tax=Subtercola lobariae TaxID=1588641 RepID=A0A917F082_9MICO|nr:DUF1697 domain-containing protein [Subtercola lobariae]GGF39170.1 hypothetical protein GCM10011399_35050 [Subtercola lobariae]